MIAPRFGVLSFLRDVRESALLECLYPSRRTAGGWTRLADRPLPDTKKPHIINLENFSFIDNPIATLNGLAQIAEAEATRAVSKINFQDEFCKDVVPFMLLVECWQEMLPVFEGGKMDHPMQKVLAAIGIEYALGITLNGIADFDDVWAYPLRRRRGAGTSRSTKRFIDVPTRGHAVDGFCDAINEWLGRPEFALELTDSGTGWIKNLLNELLENAERHSDGDRKDGSWSVSGFLARREIGGVPHFVAQIGILSLGDTFSESLERALPQQLDDIRDYVRNMRKLGAKQSDDTLRTLAALQDGVTCHAEADANNRGGTGLMEMLEMVEFLGSLTSTEYRPQVTIISGNTCIQLYDEYLHGTIMMADSKAQGNRMNNKDGDKCCGG